MLKSNVCVGMTGHQSRDNSLPGLGPDPGVVYRDGISEEGEKMASAEAAAVLARVSAVAPSRGF